jgi:beta-phosphoglucomutase
MIQAIVFDMDGVLIEAKDWHYEALNQALRLFGFEISRYDHLTTFDGLPTRRKLQLLSAEGNLPAELHDFINEMKQRYTIEIVAAKCKPRFVHQYALSRLRAEGYRLAVGSNSIRSTIETMMRQAELAQYLEFILSNEDVAKAKPDPEIYNQAIARLELAASDVLIVEDNENGIRSARDSGAHVLVVQSVDEVNYFSITQRIAECNRLMSAQAAG